jgi:hypothetical protein
MVFTFQSRFCARNKRTTGKEKEIRQWTMDSLLEQEMITSQRRFLFPYKETPE